MDADTSFDAVFAKLREFSELPAFELLSAARSDAYFGGVSNAVGELTVSELAELSAPELQELGLTATDREIIIQQLDPLVSEKLQTDAHKEQQEEEFSATPGAASADNTNPGMTLSSVAQEQLLTNTLNELAGWSRLAVTGNQPLGSFWVDNDVRAPFEELITLKQLAHMSVRSLLAKRSMTGAKIVAITNAVQRAMKDSERTAPNTKELPTSSPVSNLSKGAQSGDSDLTQRLLAAALKELSPAQRAKVLMSVAMPEATSTRRKTTRKPATRKRGARKLKKKSTKKSRSR